MQMYEPEEVCVTICYLETLPRQTYFRGVSYFAAGSKMISCRIMLQNNLAESWLLIKKKKENAPCVILSEESSSHVLISEE